MRTCSVDDTFNHDGDRPLAKPSSSEVASSESPKVFETLKMRKEGAVLFADIAAPPMNLLGPALVRDLVSLIQQAEADHALKVLVFRSSDPDFFISHVDVTKIKEYRREAAKLTGEASIALLFRHLSASRLVTIAQIEGRVRAAGNEFVLACDMRFAARESAIFAQPEPAFGVAPGGGRCPAPRTSPGSRSRARSHVVAEDYSAELAERYGWINRALPADALHGFVSSLAHRIADFRSAALRRSRPASTKSHSRRPTTFGVIPISSAKVRRSRGSRPVPKRAETRPADTRRGNGPGSTAGRTGRRRGRYRRQVRDLKDFRIPDPLQLERAYS